MEIVSKAESSFTGMAVSVLQSQLFGHSGQIQSHSSSNSDDLVGIRSEISTVENTVCSAFSLIVVFSNSDIKLAVVSLIVFFCENVSCVSSQLQSF